MNRKAEKCLVSCCLIGLCTRYDGCSKPNSDCLEVLQRYVYLPVCPEQLGGLPTPRTPADLCDGNGRDVIKGHASVIDRQGFNVTKQFIAGAEAVLKIARAQDIKVAMLKAGSPSCGLTPVPGVTAALLLEHKIRVIEF